MEPIRGIILYREDMEILRNKMSREDAAAVMFALSDYAAGIEPEEMETEQAAVAFEFMKQKVDVNMIKYMERAEKRKAAAEKAAAARWDKEKGGSDEGGASEDPHDSDAGACEGMPPDAEGCAQKDANECEGMRTHAEASVENQTDAKNQKAATDILVRYRVNQAASNVKQVAEWIQSLGQPEVESAFVRAAGADSRGGLSLKFVEAVMNETGARKNKEMTRHTPGERRRSVQAAMVSLG